MFKIYIVKYIINGQLYVQNLHSKVYYKYTIYLLKKKAYDLILYTMSLSIK